MEDVPAKRGSEMAALEAIHFVALAADVELFSEVESQAFTAACARGREQ